MYGRVATLGDILQLKKLEISGKLFFFLIYELLLTIE